MILRRKPVRKLETPAGELQRAAPEIADTVVAAAGGRQIDVALTVRRDPPACLPDSTFPAARCRLEDCEPLLQVARVECLNEALLRPVLVVRIGHDVRERDIEHVVDHQQPRPLECAFHVRERPLRSGERERQQLWRIVFRASVGYVQRIQPQVVFVLFRHQGDHIQSARWHIDEGRSENAMMDRPDPAVAWSGSAEVARPQRLRLRRIVGVKCVHRISHRGDEQDVVALAGDVEVGNDQRKRVDAVVHAPRKELAEVSGIHVGRVEDRLLKVGTRTPVVVLRHRHRDRRAHRRAD